MSGPSAPFWADGHALRVRVRVTPKGGGDRVEGVTETAEGQALKVRVSAPPADGAANAAVVATVATWLGQPKSTVSVAGGLKSRTKTLCIAGDPDRLAATLKSRLQP